MLRTHADDEIAQAEGCPPREPGAACNDYGLGLGAGEPSFGAA